jgi:hypothetical protein
MASVTLPDNARERRYANGFQTTPLSAKTEMPDIFVGSVTDKVNGILHVFCRPFTICCIFSRNMTSLPRGYRPRRP